MTSPLLGPKWSSPLRVADCFRVWKWVNGIPVALGTIDVACTEEEFVATFVNAMPQRGEGKAQFRLRPVDSRGREMGKEFSLHISEHHVALGKFRSEEEVHDCPNEGYKGAAAPSRMVEPDGTPGPWIFCNNEVQFCPLCGKKLPGSILEELAEVPDE